MKYSYSINLEPEDYAKLNYMAMAQGLGIATITRTIIKNFLVQHDSDFEGKDLVKFQKRRKYRPKEIIDKNQMEITDITK